MFSATTRITFQDNVSTVLRGTFRAQRWKPEFANNTAQLRKVIAVLVWQHAHGRLPFPEGLENDLPRLEQLAKTSIGRWNRMLAKDQKRRKWHHKSLSEHQRKIIERHVFTTSWSGGTLQILAAVAYLSWNWGIDVLRRWRAVVHDAVARPDRSLPAMQCSSSARFRDVCAASQSPPKVVIPYGSNDLCSLGALSCH